MTELDTRFFPLIFNSIPHGIFTIDAEGRVTAFNNTAEQLTGYSREEAIGRRCYEIFRADVCQQGCPLKKSLESRTQEELIEATILTRDGVEVPISISTNALVDDDGKLIGGVEMFRDLSQIVELRKKIEGMYEFEDIVSKNSRMLTILERLPLFAASSSSVLIEGVSGTGKELIARALHSLGPRSQKPFVAVNCAAIPDNLLESELFGYVRGAFTDAKKDKPGRFSLADGGTLFLDEIGEISQPMQVKLLRVLQEKEFEPLGATHSVKVDVRLVAATNKVLVDEIREGRFREDLYYRLNVIHIDLPPLSQRREDIPLLANHFRRRFNTLQGRSIGRISDSAMAALMSAPFPGNVRELENAIEHAFVMCRGDTILQRDLPSGISENYQAHSDDEPANPLHAAEADAIRQVLERHEGNRTRAAEELGISRNTLWRKMKKFGLS